MNINKYYCEGCKNLLYVQDWPYSFRGLMRLCNKCKQKAYYFLTRRRSGACADKPFYTNNMSGT